MEQAQAIVDDAWQEVLRGLYTQQNLGLVPERLPDLSVTEASRRSAVGTALITRLNKVDAGVLPHDLALSLRLMRFRAKMWAREEQLYWTACDPLGVGFFEMFLPTAYCGGFLLNFVHAIIRSLVHSSRRGNTVPRGLLLLSPELDLTESGDTFQTLLGVDHRSRSCR